MANDALLKPSLFVQTLLPQLEEESFLNFLRAYYEWLQSTKITFSGKIGNFTKEETVVGDDSKARGIIKEVGSNYLVVKMLTDAPFDLRETFEGQSSGAIANIFEIKDNVIRASARAQKNRNPDTSVDKYFEYLKSEFNKGFPTVSEVDRRLISTKLKEFYQSKSNEDAYRFLFRAVYGSEIEFRYPGEEILRVSDGDFEKTTIVRVVPTDEIFDYLNQTVVGQSSQAVGNVVDIKVTFLGGVQYAELVLSLASGTFIPGETIVVLGAPEKNTTVFGMITGVNIIDAGSGYELDDELTITGDGFEATAKVSSVSSGPITKIKVNDIGYGYRLGTLATVDNTGTGGENFLIEVTGITNTYTVIDGSDEYTVGEISKITIVNRGSGYFKTPTITLEDSVISSLGILSEDLMTIQNPGTGYSVGDGVVFSVGIEDPGEGAEGTVASVGNTAPYGEDNLLFEDSTTILLDDTVNGKTSAIKNEDWSNLGPILRIELSSFGQDYDESFLPTVEIISSGLNGSITVDGIQGKSANVEVDVANNSVGIGSIRAITISNPGIDYTTATIDASSIGDGNANLQPIISGIAISDGVFLTDDGKINVKILQDSLFYQDFSYVIKSGLVFNAYRDLVKQSIHPVGLQFFGEILISSYILAAAQFTSVISTEQTVIDVTIKQILSFFSGASNPIYHSMEKNIELAPYNVGDGQIEREINIEIAPEVQNVEVSTKTEIDKNISQSANVSFIDTDSSRKIDLIPKLDIQAFNPFRVSIANFSDLPISFLESEQISSYLNTRFDTEFFNRTVFVNEKITGTVTVSGTVVSGNGTTFDTDFAADDSIIIDSEKFIVKSVANSEYMTINVTPSGTYSNVSAYKESIV